MEYREIGPSSPTEVSLSIRPFDLQSLWPLPAQHVVLVRHGESTGNVIFDRCSNPDPFARLDAYEEIRRMPPTASWGLTQEGGRQAHAAGIWIHTHQHEFPILEQSDDPVPTRPYGARLSSVHKRRVAPQPLFDSCWVSPYARAVESAVALHLEGLSWQFSDKIIERSWGDYEGLGDILFGERYPEAWKMSREDPFNWAPPNGESFAQVTYQHTDPMAASGRLIEFLNESSNDESPAKRMLIVGHSDLQWGFRYLFEGMTLGEFRTKYLSRDPAESVTYGQITHYTKIDPHTQRLGPAGVLWMRVIDPMNPESAKIPWRQLILAVPDDITTALARAL